MPAIVSFFTAEADPNSRVGKIVRVRATESVAMNGVTTNQARKGELVSIANTEAAMILAAFGTTPDAATASDTSASSAGYPVEIGAVSPPMEPGLGGKVSVKLA